MKKLSEVVNVVPVIAKSDSLTIDERLNFKDRIRAELLHHNIRVYPFDTDEYDDEETQLNERIRVRVLGPRKGTSVLITRPRTCRISFPSPLLAQSVMSSSTESPFVAVKTGGG